MSTSGEQTADWQQLMSDWEQVEAEIAAAGQAEHQVGAERMRQLEEQRIVLRARIDSAIRARQEARGPVSDYLNVAVIGLRR